MFQAVVLGVVQGLSEFIPISSDGHLLLVPALLGWGTPGLAFEVALHWGTTLAMIAYFRQELAAMARGLLGRDRSHEGLLYRRLAILALVSTIPVGVVGLAVKDAVGDVFESPVAASVFLYGSAAVLFAAERHRDRRVRRAGARAQAVHAATGPVAVQTSRLPVGADPADPTGKTLEGVTLRQALPMGAIQILALLPGWSRSGSTIFAGVTTGLTREAATRFSFLLSFPAVLGALLVTLPDLAAPGQRSGVELAAGIGAATVVGYLAIRWLVRLVSRERLTGFAWYCVAAGTFGLLGTFLLA